MSFKTFLQRFQVEYLVNVLKAAFNRFPLSVSVCAFGTVLCMLMTHDVKIFSDDMNARIMLFVSNSAVLFTAAKLFAESSGFDAAKRWSVMAVCGAVVAAFAFIPDHFSASHLFFGAALSLSMLFAPYILRKSDEDSVWYYNYSNGISLVISGLSTLLLCIGLCAIVGSMDYLFELHVPGKLYGDIWIFGAGFFGPLLFLSYLPRQFDFAKEECVLLPGIYFIANYLLVPLVLIMTWVLYAYFAKIVYKWELPRGNLAYMVTGFGAAGIIARLAVFPMRENGTKLLQQFYRYFYYLLLIPVGLLALGLYTRLTQYGMTEERYAILLALIWLAALSVFSFIKPKQAHIKHVPMLLCALFLLASFGPWGAVPVSTASQVSRLENFLKAAEVIKADGSIAKTTKEVAFNDRKEISSITEYLISRDREASIDKYVAPFAKEIAPTKEQVSYSDACKERSFFNCTAQYDRAEKLVNAWGMKWVTRWDSDESDEYYSLTTTDNNWYGDKLMKVAPYEYIARLNLGVGENPSAQPFSQQDKDGIKLKYKLSPDGKLQLQEGEAGPLLAFDLAPIAKKFYDEKVTSVPADKAATMVLTAESGSFRARLEISDIRGRMKNGVLVFESATMTAFISP